MTIVGAVGLLFVLPFLGACSSSNSFWDRSPCVAGARQVAPDRGCAPRSTPPTYRCPPSAAPQQAAPSTRAPQYRTQQPSYTPPSAEAPRTQAPPSTAQGPVHAPASTLEMALLDRVNRVRSQHSLRPLRFEANLWIAARAHSDEQKRHGYMGHGSPDPARRTLAQRMGQAGYTGSVFAEVVAWGYSDTASVVEGWMNSPDHRRILLDAELTEGAFSRVGEYWTGNLGAPRRFRRATPTPTPDTGTTFRRAPAPAPSPRYTAPPTRRTAPAPRAAAPRATTPRRAKPAPRRQLLPIVPSKPSTGFG